MAKQPLKLLPAEHYSRTYALYLPAETTLDDITAPGFWANVAKTLAAGDEIKVVAEDLSWRAMLMVRAVGRVEALVHVLAFDVMGDQAALSVPESSIYTTKWRGPSKKWSVVKKDTGEVVKEDFPVQEAAAKWIAGHMKAMAA